MSQEIAKTVRNAAAGGLLLASSMFPLGAHAEQHTASEPNSPVPYSVVDSGYLAKTANENVVMGVVRSLDDANRMLNTELPEKPTWFNATVDPSPIRTALLSIDYTKYQAEVFVDQARPTAGFQLSEPTITQASDGTQTVNLTETLPDPNKLHQTVDTKPYMVLVTPQTENKVSFNLTVVQASQEQEATENSTEIPFTSMGDSNYSNFDIDGPKLFVARSQDELLQAIKTLYPFYESTDPNLRLVQQPPEFLINIVSDNSFDYDKQQMILFAGQPLSDASFSQKIEKVEQAQDAIIVTAPARRMKGNGLIFEQIIETPLSVVSTQRTSAILPIAFSCPSIEQTN